MGELSGAQRKYLRGIAHGYKPVVQIGKEGLRDSVIDAIDAAIEAHELIKIKIAVDRDERARFVPIIEQRLGCECVGTVGRMAILFRRHPDPEKQKIIFPKGRRVRNPERDASSPLIGPLSTPSLSNRR